MGIIYTLEEQQRFTEFTQALTALSKQTGIVLQAIGGVMVTDTEDPCLDKLGYTDDISSGDLEPTDWYDSQ
jgi:hypothetical protein